MRITIYGPGCAKCAQTVELVQRLLAETGVQAALEKVTDIQAIAAAGLLTTPAVAVDGVVKLKGRVPTADEVRAWIGR